MVHITICHPGQVSERRKPRRQHVYSTHQSSVIKYSTTLHDRQVPKSAASHRSSVIKHITTLHDRQVPTSAASHRSSVIKHTTTLHDRQVPTSAASHQFCIFEHFATSTNKTHTNVNFLPAVLFPKKRRLKSQTQITNIYQAKEVRMLSMVGATRVSDLETKHRPVRIANLAESKRKASGKNEKI